MDRLANASTVYTANIGKHWRGNLVAQLGVFSSYQKAEQALRAYLPLMQSAHPDKLLTEADFDISVDELDPDIQSIIDD